LTRSGSTGHKARSIRMRQPSKSETGVRPL
jgi:hypothetical protein